jgi:hypothetical protein
MKLFKIDIDRGRDGRALVVHAETEEAALAHVRGRFRGWSVSQLIEILGEAHFTVALLEAAGDD